jgi:hypothetical protein
MKVIDPVTLTDAMLASISLPEPAAGETLWNAGTNYATGTTAARTTTHRIYERLAPGGVDAALPESAPDKWKELRPTNRWAMFDESVGTASTVTGVGTVTITTTITPGRAITAVGFFELNAQSVLVEVLDSVGGSVVYTKSVELDETELLDWFQYFFEPFSLRSTLVLLDLPPYASGQLRLTFTGQNSVSVGNVVFGTVYEMGVTGYGATAGIRDYSRKKEDEETQIVRLERRRFAKIMRVRFRLNEEQVNFVHRLLSTLRSTPAVWVADNGSGLEALVVYGFYKDFTLDLAAKISHYSLEIEGMA